MFKIGNFVNSLVTVYCYYKRVYTCTFKAYSYFCV